MRYRRAENLKSPLKIHRAWIVLFGCCLLLGGSMGLIVNCRGIFYAPVSEDLGFKMGTFSFYVMFYGVFCAFALPTAEKLFSRLPFRPLLLTASIVFSVSIFAMGLFTRLPFFYIAGIAQGVSGAFIMFFTVPVILRNWFKQSGLAVGISSACAGLMGVIASPLGTAVIERFGWRYGYYSFGIVSALMMLPSALFLIHYKPEDIGFTAYEGKRRKNKISTADLEKNEINFNAETVKKTKSFWMLIAAGLCSSMICGFTTYLSAWSVFLGQGSNVGAWMISTYMAGNMLSKIAFGKFHDRFGLRSSLIVSSSTVIAGLLLLNLKLIPLRLAASFMFGTCTALCAVLFPLSVKDLYGNAAYSRLLSYASTVNACGGPIFTVVLGYVIDGTKSFAGYNIALWLNTLTAMIMLFLFLAAMREAEKLV